MHLYDLCAQKKISGHVGGKKYVELCFKVLFHIVISKDTKKGKVLSDYFHLQVAALFTEALQELQCFDMPAGSVLPASSDSLTTSQVWLSEK